jgi:hypothetical protein
MNSSLSFLSFVGARFLCVAYSSVMQEALRVLEAYERTFFTGLPEVETNMDLDKSKRTLSMVSECFKKSKDLQGLATEFVDVLSIPMTMSLR